MRGLVSQQRALHRPASGMHLEQLLKQQKRCIGAEWQAVSCRLGHLLRSAFGQHLCAWFLHAALLPMPHTLKAASAGAAEHMAGRVPQPAAAATRRHLRCLLPAPSQGPPRCAGVVWLLMACVKACTSQPSPLHVHCVVQPLRRLPHALHRTGHLVSFGSHPSVCYDLMYSILHPK